mmetsp:Transcript_518/g.1575  ORF Transcript_518/g.1575 Transcript_518/m.1575 type:complete len:345 (+) Transcript_518:610-1644(+)
MRHDEHHRLHQWIDALGGLQRRLARRPGLEQGRQDPCPGPDKRSQARRRGRAGANPQRGRRGESRRVRAAGARVGGGQDRAGHEPLRRRRRVQEVRCDPQPRGAALRAGGRTGRQAGGGRRSLRNRGERRRVGVHRIARGVRDRRLRARLDEPRLRQARARGGAALEARGGKLPGRHHRDRRAAALHLWLCHRRRAAGAGPRRRGLLLHQPRRAGDLQVWARARDRDEAKVTRGGPGGGEQPRLDARQPRRGRRVGLRQEAALGRVSRRRRLWSRALGQLPFPRRLGGWHRGGVRTVGVVRLGVAGGRSRLHEPSLSKNNALDVHVARFRRSHAAVLSCVICDL